MPKTTIDATDPTTGQRRAVPPGLLEAVRKAADWLDDDLRPLDERFGIAVHWRVQGASPGAADWVEVVLASETAGASVTRRLGPSDFRDGQITRTALRPVVESFTRQLSAYVNRLFDESWRGLQHALEAYAAAEG